VPYDFSETDFRISMALISTYLTKAASASSSGAAANPQLADVSAAAVPWGTLRYLIGEAMYGACGSAVLGLGLQRETTAL